jgi:biotin carboxyl carrier protein
MSSALMKAFGFWLPLQAPQAGEIVSFVANEGTAVEYNQEIIELMPFFGGHIIGDRKHA